MQNVSAWKPTKFEIKRGKWRGSRDASRVMPSSRLMADRIAAAYSSAIAKHATGDLLDLGCGFVPLYGMYRHYARTVTCADWPQSLHASTHLDLEVDLTKSIPIGDLSFDSILLTDVLEHLPNPDFVWGELFRIMRTGGVLIVGVPFLYWLHEQPHDYFRYTEHRLRLFCKDFGFDVVSLEPYGGPLDVVADTVAKILQHFALVRWIVPPLMAAANLAGNLVKSAQTPMPLGYVLVARKK